MNRRILLLALCLMAVAAPPVRADVTDFVETYTYRAGESDSKLTCRTVSLIEAKRLLLEKIGTYIETHTEVKNFAVTRDDIVALTAGIVRTEILSEEWNGETYRLIARIEADPDDILEKIEGLQNRQADLDAARRLTAVNQESLERMQQMQAEMNRLQSDLVKVNQDLNAHEGILSAWGLYEEGTRLRQAGQPREAVAVMDRALSKHPSAAGFFERGKAYLELDRPAEAAKDFTEALKREPDRRGALHGRAKAYWKLGRKQAAIADMRKAAALGQGQARKWLKRHRVSE